MKGILSFLALEIVEILSKYDHPELAGIGK
jgi:hypothetical protein